METNDPEKNLARVSSEEETISYAEGCLEVMQNAIPATFGLLFVFITETINIIYIGRFDDPNLISGIGIGTLYINATGYILGAGIIGGIDTLCTQCFGAKEYKLLGIFTNIARISVLGFFLFISVPFAIYAYEILEFIGQFDVISVIASNFCLSMIPSLFFALQYNASLRYLQAMNIFLPGMCVTLSTAILHPLWCHLFIYTFNFSVIGAGISMGITQLLNLIIITIYIHWKNPCPESYFFINKECLNVDLIYDYLKNAIPAAILFAADWLGFEVLTLMASYISAVDLAANICLFNFITIIFMMSMGLSIATSTLVGNSIGAKKPEKAKNYTISALLVGIVLMTTITIVVNAFQDQIPYLYTAEPEVVTLFIDLIDIWRWFSIIDMCQVILNGVIKGLGKQFKASMIALFVLYPLNIPLAYYLAFVQHIGVMGLWYSQLISVFILAFSYAYIVFNADYVEISEKIIEHLKDDDNKLEELKHKLM